MCLFSVKTSLAKATNDGGRKIKRCFEHQAGKEIYYIGVNIGEQNSVMKRKEEGESTSANRKCTLKRNVVYLITASLTTSVVPQYIV